MTPGSVVAGSEKVAWWSCAIDRSHEWQQSIANRTRLAAGCPYCRLYPRSKQEIRLAFELKLFFSFDPSAHKVSTSTRVEDVDIILSQQKVIIEFDGSYWHRGKLATDTAKTRRLVAAGWQVVRVREHPLRKITPLDVVFRPRRPGDLNVKPVVDKLLSRLARVIGKTPSGVGRYLLRKSPSNQEAADRYVRKLLVARRGDR